MNALTISVPLNLPTDEEVRALILEGARQAAREKGSWLTLDEAAEYLKMARRTFDRYRAQWGLPVAELSEGFKLVRREDLDAAVAAHLVTSSANVIDFPSLAMREAAVSEQHNHPTGHKGAA